MHARLLASMGLVALLTSSCVQLGGSHGTDGGGTHGGSDGGAADSGADAGPTPSSCVPDADYFQTHVWNRVVATRCAICHSAGGVAKGSRMVYVPATTPGAMETNLAAAKVVALATEEGQPLLVRRPTGINHVGGVVVTTDSAEYLALADFTARVRGDPGACDAKGCQAGDPGPRLLRRLTRDEYDNTLHDLFSISSTYGAAMVADVQVHGFDNNARALTVSPLLVDQLRKAAEAVGPLVAAKPEYACTGDGPTCAQAFLKGAASRIFRRPLTDAEIARWLAVYQTGRDTAPSGTPAHQSGMELLIAGMLQSPAFLYRAELGTDNGAGGYTLTSYEVASELSYFLWGSPPDEVLWNAAVSDQLKDADAVAAQAKRLLASPRARASLDRFVAQWLTASQIGFVPKDADVYPEMTDAIRSDMAEELSRLFASVAQGDGSLSDLFTSKTTYVSAALASFYGIAAPTSKDSTGFGKVQGRNGLLGAGAVLTVHGRPNGSSPISRGKLVREQLLCQVLPTPPSGVVAQPPAPDPAQTTRERYTSHSSNPACYSCHRLVDPIGFGFEHFDGIGRYRATEGTLPIDDSGEIGATSSSDGTFVGIDELSAHLATSSEVASCFALEWARFAYALRENAQTSCLTDDVSAKFVEGGGKVSDLIVALTQTSQFRQRTADPPEPASDAGAGSPDAGAGTPDAGPGGADGGSAADAGTSPSDGGNPDVTPGVTAVVTNTNSWATGYCATVTVSNSTSQSATWQVSVTIEGTIYNHWSFNILSQNGTSYTLSGQDFDATVAPGGKVEGGFCANL